MLEMPRTDPTARYLGTLDALRRARLGSLHGAVVRYAAVMLAGTDVADPCPVLQREAKELRQRAGWTSPLRAGARYAVASLAVRRGQPCNGLHYAIQDIRRRFRAQKLPRGGLAEVLAASVLSFQSAEVNELLLDRIQILLDIWKRDHPMISGNFDYPMAALLATHEEEIGTLARRVEETYRELNRAGFGRGHKLQLASHILGMSEWWAGRAAGRFKALTWSFADRGYKIRRGDYDGIALLSLCSGAPDDIAPAVLQTRVKIRKAFGFPRRNDPLMIAAGLAMRDPGFGLMAGDGALDGEAVQDILEAALGSELARLAHHHGHLESFGLSF